MKARSRRERVEASRRRNRERGYDEGWIARAREIADGADREQLLRQQAAGPRFAPVGDGSRRCEDRWGGPQPPAA